MKGEILCPICAAKGRKPKILGKHEDVAGRGTLYLWCKSCGREITIDLRSISIDD